MLKYLQWTVCAGVCLSLVYGQALETNPSQADEVSSKGVASTPITISEVFDRYDTNQNGVLERNECVCRGSKLCDLNRDGKVTRREFSKGVAKFAGSHEAAIRMITEMGGIEKYYEHAKSIQKDETPEVSMDSLFAQWDRDESGVLERDECVCAGSKAADTDRNGEVSKEEMAYLAEQHFGSVDKFLDAVRKRGGVESYYNSVATDGYTIGAVFARYDKNKNGSLERHEWTCQTSRMSDLNRDGRVTEEEMAVVASRAFGSLERFENYVKSQGGATKFHAQRHR